MLREIDRHYLEQYKEKYVMNCPICHGTFPGCTCWANFKLEIAKVSAGIPIKFRQFKLKQLTHPQLVKQKELIKNYIKNLNQNRGNGNSLYIYGTKGTAKSMCASIIIMNALKHNFKAYYFDSMKTISEMLKQDWHNDEETLSNIITTYDFIVVDNLDLEDVPNQNVLATIKSLFYIRANNLLPTIFVSSVPISKLALPLDGAIIEYFTPVLTDIYFNGFDYAEAVLKKVRGKKNGN